MKYDRFTQKTIAGGYTTRCMDCKYKDECEGYDVDCEYYLLRELGRLEEKLENGTLVEMPCKVGDKIWIITMIWRGKSFIGEIHEANVEAFYILKGLIQIEDDLFYELHNYGEDVFLSQAEAEAKLKVLQNV